MQSCVVVERAVTRCAIAPRLVQNGSAVYECRGGAWVLLSDPRALTCSASSLCTTCSCYADGLRIECKDVQFSEFPRTPRARWRQHALAMGVDVVWRPVPLTRAPVSLCRAAAQRAHG